jgi:hypothetical protein
MPYDYADLWAAAKEVIVFCLLFIMPIALCTYVVGRIGVDR